MAITFRANKGKALTYNEMDTNFGSFFFSSSLSNGGNTLNLHYKDSSAVPVNQAAHSISLVTTLAGGTDKRIPFYSGSSALSTTEGFLVDNGKVGIKVDETNDVPLTYELEVSGSIRASKAVYANSDERLKDNITTIPYALDKVQDLRGVEFNWTGDFKTQLGVIAQEVNEVLPEVVEQDNIGHYQVNYSAIVPVLIEAIKELKAEIDELKNNR